MENPSKGYNLKLSFEVLSRDFLQRYITDAFGLSYVIGCSWSSEVHCVFIKKGSIISSRYFFRNWMRTENDSNLNMMKDKKKESQSMLHRILRSVYKNNTSY